MIAKGAPWTRSSLAGFGSAVASVDSYPPAPSRPDPYAGPQQLRAFDSQGRNPYSNLPKPADTRSQPQVYSSGSILAFPSQQRQPDAEHLRAQKQQLFDYYQAAMREKAQRGKDDVTADPLKSRAAELTQQYDRDRARVRKAVGSSILAPDISYGDGRRVGNSSLSVPAQESRSRGNPLEDIANMRKRRGWQEQVAPVKTSASQKSFAENQALFFGEAAQLPPKPTYNPPQRGSSSYQENAARFFGDSGPSQPPIRYEAPKPRGSSFEENKAAFFGVDAPGEARQVSRNSSVVSTGAQPASYMGDMQQPAYANSPILGKTLPRSTVSDPITGVVRTVSSQRPRYQPLGKEKPEVISGKINDSPAPPANIYGSQPTFTKKSGNKPYSYNPLTGQDYEYGAGNPFRGSAAYLR